MQTFHIGQTIECLYTDKDGAESERRGVIVPNAKNMSDKYVTIRQEDGSYRALFVDRIDLLLYVL